MVMVKAGERVFVQRSLARAPGPYVRTPNACCPEGITRLGPAAAYFASGGKVLPPSGTL